LTAKEEKREELMSFAALGAVRMLLLKSFGRRGSEEAIIVL
jgi:hypothetical protein